MAIEVPDHPAGEAVPPEEAAPPAPEQQLQVPAAAVPENHQDDIHGIQPISLNAEQKHKRAMIPLVKLLANRPALLAGDDDDDDDHDNSRAHHKKHLHEGHPLSRLAQANKKVGLVDDSRCQLRWRLKTQPGWRQNRRWHSDALIGVPNRQPPEPSDWEVRHTHEPEFPPYQLAARWDAGGLRKHVQDRTLRAQVSRKACARRAGLASGFGAGEVPKDLREAAKRNPVVRAWVQTLEEPVRAFAQAVTDFNSSGSGSGGSSDGKDDITDGFEKLRKQNKMEEKEEEEKEEEELDTCTEGDGDEIVLSEMDEEFEVILFKGRRASRKLTSRPKLSGPNGFVHVAKPHEGEEDDDDDDEEEEEEEEQPYLVLDGFGDNDSSFKRWLAHALAAYYGLESRSVTVAPAGRVVEVRAKPMAKKQKKQTEAPTLPRPMWELC